MKFAILFYFFSICLLSKLTLAAFVSDLKPDANCDAILSSKAAEREKDPSVMNKTTTTNEIDYTKATSIYDFIAKDTYQVDVPLGEFCRGMVTLIVNIGSACGLTAPNYAQLTQINKDFDGKMRILIFPCNQFMDQMPEGDGDEMLCHFKQRNADPGAIFAKVNVNGDNAIPLYKYLEAQMKGEKGSDVEWNFAKFLIDKKGKVVKRYHPQFEPNNIVDDIKSLM